MEPSVVAEIIELTPPPDPARPTGGGRLPLLVSAAALIVSLAALGLAYVDRRAPTACSSAWDAGSTNLSLPPGWTIRDTWYSLAGVNVSLDGPGPTSREGAAFLSWNCYGDGASAARFLALTRTAAQRGTGHRVVVNVPRIGEETVALSTPNGTDTEFDIYWRRGDIITWLDSPSSLTLPDLETLATAVDSTSGR